MAMLVENEVIEIFKKSNKFSLNNPTSFRINLAGQGTVPGKHDPEKYLKSLNKKLSGKVAVVGSGNLGLSFELSKNPDIELIDNYEPRYLFSQASLSAKPLLSKIKNLDNVNVYSALPNKHKFYDYIFLPCTLDDMENKKTVLNQIYKSLAEGGSAFLDVTKSIDIDYDEKLYFSGDPLPGLKENSKLFIVNKAVSMNLSNIQGLKTIQQIVEKEEEEEEGGDEQIDIVQSDISIISYEDKLDFLYKKKVLNKGQLKKAEKIYGKEFLDEIYTFKFNKIKLDEQLSKKLDRIKSRVRSTKGRKD